MNDHRATAIAAPAPTTLPVALQPLPVRAVLPWLLMVGLLALVTMYFVGAEQGATSLLNGTAVHEWTHDGRHLLGFPCH
jgi:hypothetical protein